MLASTILISTLLTLVSGLPTSSDPLSARAGGPAIVPIPSTCKLPNPQPTDAQNYLPNDSANQDKLYEAYYGSGTFNAGEEQTHCFEQCYGWGGGSGCKAAFWAENLIVPAGYYGSPGGDLSVGCLLFSRELTQSDFEVAPEGQATNGLAANLEC